MSVLVQMRRAGRPVTLIDKIRAEADPKVLRGMRDAVAARGEMTPALERVFRERADEIGRQREGRHV